MSQQGFIHTSKKPSSHLQGTVLRDSTRCQREVILQWATGEQQHLVFNQETLKSLDVGLKYTANSFGLDGVSRMMAKIERHDGILGRNVP
jgi:hypothetical protein